MRGTVKFFHEAKGYGFIRPDTGGQDVFLHITAVVAGVTLKEGDIVEYDIGRDPRTGRDPSGERATGLTISRNVLGLAVPVVSLFTGGVRSAEHP